MREFFEIVSAIFNGLIDSVAVLLGVKKGAAIAAFVSAIISLRFVPDMVSWRQKLWMVSGGFFCAVFLAPGIAELFEFKEKTEYAIIFGVGMLGLSVAAAISKLIASGEVWTLIKNIIRGKLGMQSMDTPLPPPEMVPLADIPKEKQ